MFIVYVIKNFYEVLVLWVILTVINQMVFFGACLQPYCILASVPHISIITLILYYYSFNYKKTTYDEKTGYNKFGYDKDGYNIKGYTAGGYDKHGYDKYGYNIDGFADDGYNVNGIDKNGLDRKFQGSIARFLTTRESKQELKELNNLANQKIQEDYSS